MHFFFLSVEEENKYEENEYTQKEKEINWEENYIHELQCERLRNARKNRNDIV